MEERLLKLENIILNLESRINKIENKINPQIEPQTTKPKVQKEINQNLIYHEESVLKEDKESKSGSWLATVGILFFILAASFFIKLSIESGWLTPVRQLFGAVLFGLILIRVGYHMRKIDMSYSNFLPATGLVILYMAAYSGHLYWNLYESIHAIVLAGIISIYALSLFKNFKHDIFLIASTLGSFFVPLLIGQKNTSLYQSCFYFIFWDILYCYFAIKLNRRLLIGLTAYLSLTIWHLLYLSQNVKDNYIIFACTFQAIQYLLLVCSIGLFSIKQNRALTLSEAWSLFPTLVLFYAIEYSMLSRIFPNMAPWLSICFGVFLISIYLFVKNKLNLDKLNSEPVLTFFISIILWHSLYLEILPLWFCPWLSLILIAALAILNNTRFNYDNYWPIYFLFGGVILYEYIQTLDSSLPRQSPNILINILFFTALFFAYLKDSNTLFLLLADIQILVGISRLAKNYANTPLSLYLTSGAWALFGVAILFFALSKKDQILAKSSLFIFAIVSAKVIFIDIGSSGTITKIIALVIIGSLLYFAGLLWKRVEAWNINPKLN